MFKLDLGTRWNEVEYVTFNTTFEAESAINGDIFADLKTSIPKHENYGTRLKLNVDLSELPSASTVIVVTYPSNRVRELYLLARPKIITHAYIFLLDWI